MAANEINLTIKVSDDGNLKIVGKNADAAAAGLDKTGKSAQSADRALKGAAQASANGTKNFSKMAQGISGGLVPAYATLAANVFAVSAAFNFFKAAADLRVIQESQENYARSTGTSLSLLTSRIQEATDGVLTFQEAAQAVSIGTASGLNSEQLTGLAQVAKNASLALGRDLSDSFDRLVRGATKAEPELLDELGIILRLETATQKYANALGKNAKDLTAYQRTQAVVNEVLEQGNQKFDDLGGQVNKIAKLGKAFNDLLKDVKSVLTPIAEFFAGALSNNVLALAGAFTLLGQGILKAIVPVPPALADIGEAADAATKRIQAALPDDPSALGKNIASGDIGGREIAALERSTTAASSKVVDYSKTTQKAVARDVAIIKAQHEAMIAQNTAGFKRYTASAKAELFALQATHGKVMGTMAAGVAQFGRIASKVIGAAGLIGLLFTALGVIKELLNKLKDPALIRALELSGAIRAAAEEQNQAIGDLLDNLNNKSGTVQERMTELANVIANFDFRQFERVPLIIGDVRRSVGSQRRGIGIEFDEENLENFVGAARAAGESLQLQIKALKQAGKDTSGLEQKFEELNTAVNNFEKAADAASAGRFKGSLEDFQERAGAVESALSSLEPTTKKATAGLVDQGAAFKSLTQIGEEYRDFTASLAQTGSTFERSLTITKNAIDSVTGALGKGDPDAPFLKVFQEDKGGADILNILKGITDEQKDSITVAEVLERLQAKRTKTLQLENAVHLQALKTQTLREQVLRNTTPLQQEALNNEFQQRNIIDQIAKLEAEREQMVMNEVDMSSTEAKINDQNLKLLNAQLETLRQQRDELLQIQNAAKNAFEGATQKGIAELIKGEESSIKDAMLKIAKATLSAIADTLAKQLTERVTGLLFGTPEQKIRDAMMEAADYHAVKIKEAVGAGTGLDVAAGASYLPSGISSASIDDMINEIAAMPRSKEGTKKPETLFERFFGKEKTTTSRSDTKGAEEVTVTKRVGGSVTNFLGSLGDIFDKNAEGGFVEKLGNAFEAGGGIFKDLFGGLGDIFGSLMQGLGGGGFGGLFSLFGFAKGGVAMGGFRSAAYASGGIATRPTLGLVGEGKHNEAIVPLPDGKSIPVSMPGGAGQQNNVVVNVNIDSDGAVTQETEGQGLDLGTTIANLVQQELLNQKRQGGILNPNGVA